MIAVLRCSCRKGTTLRTAIEKKAHHAPSPVGMNETAFVSQAFDAALASLENSKAESIIPIDIRGRSSIGDYMIVASGRSHRHVTAVADHLCRLFVKWAAKICGSKDSRAVIGFSSIQAILSSIFSVRKSVISTIWKRSGSTTISKISAHRERCTDQVVKRT